MKGGNDRQKIHNEHKTQVDGYLGLDETGGGLVGETTWLDVVYFKVLGFINKSLPCMDNVETKL